MACYAHTAPNEPDWEPLKTHLLNVAVRDGRHR